MSFWAALLKMMNKKQEAEFRLETSRKVAQLARDFSILRDTVSTLDILSKKLEELAEGVNAVAPRYEFRSGSELSSCFCMNVKVNLKRIRQNVEKMTHLVNRETEQWNEKAELLKASTSRGKS